MSVESDRELAGLIRTAIRLEAERVVAMTASDRESIALIDADIDRVLASLAHHGAAHPLHAVAGRYALSGGEYAILIAALIPHVAPDLGPALSGDTALGEPTRMVDAQRALVAGLPSSVARFADEHAFLQALKSTTLLRERLIELSTCPSGELVLTPHPAVLELLGLSR